ncbi:MAG TPA: hypothetical protein EYH27_01950 [Anaerolineales bacterium]|nr:hypothetical protein [Anaerolineae bacterium]HIP87187.1 hypothetical protein [Anaerolineales bacterium]
MDERLTPSDGPKFVVSGLFTTYHRLETAAGMRGTFTFPAFRSFGLFRTPEGREWTARRTSWWRGEYELREGETVLATARPRGLLRREVEVTFGNRSYTLQPVRFWGRVWRLCDEAGTPVLEVHPKGVLRREVRLEVMSPMDLPLAVFTYYLVYARWQEEAAAAAAAAG